MNKHGYLGFVLILLSLLPSEAWSQLRYHRAFNQFGFVRPAHLEATPDGGFITGSYNESLSSIYGQNGIVLIKYNAQHQLVWSRFYYDQTQPMTVESLSITSNGDMIMTGYYGPTSGADVYLLRLDPAGNQVFFKIYQAPDGEYPYTVDELENGNLFIYANTNGFGVNPSRNVIFYIDPAGNLIWTKMFFNVPIWGRGMATSDGNMLVRAGSLIYKVDPGGNVLWANTYFQSSYSGNPVEINNKYFYVRYPDRSGKRLFCLCFGSTRQSGGTR